MFFSNFFYYRTQSLLGDKNFKKIFFSEKTFFQNCFVQKYFFLILCPQKVTKLCSKKNIRKTYFCTKQFWKKVFSEKNIFLNFLSPKSDEVLQWKKIQEKKIIFQEKIWGKKILWNFCQKKSIFCAPNNCPPPFVKTRNFLSTGGGELLDNFG